MVQNLSQELIFLINYYFFSAENHVYDVTADKLLIVFKLNLVMREKRVI